MLKSLVSQLVLFVTAFCIISVAVGAAYYLYGHHIFPLGKMICFGAYNRKSKPFAELQAEQHVALVFEQAELVHDQVTQFQHILVYSHPHFGSILVIDGSLQITARDEHIYHEMMVHVPMAYLIGKPGASAKKPLRVILIGGGDGGANTQLFKYAGIEGVHHIDIDMKAMRNVTQAFFPHLYGSFLDTRLHTYMYDGSQWVRERLDDSSQVGSFDLIIVDSTDYGSAETLFTDEFYAQLRALLRKDDRSMLLLNLDSPQWNAPIVATVQREMARLFKYSYVYTCAQPSFLSGAYAYLLVSDTVNPMTAPVDWAAWNAQRVYTHYYTPEIHYASFMLPADLQRAVSMSGQFKDVGAAGVANAQASKHDHWPDVKIAPERLQATPDTSAGDDEGEGEDGGAGGEEDDGSEGEGGSGKDL